MFPRYWFENTISIFPWIQYKAQIGGYIISSLGPNASQCQIDNLNIYLIEGEKEEKKEA